MDNEAEEYTDSEEEFTQYERQLLKKVRLGRKNEDSGDEEVLGFGNSDGESDGLPDSKAWGKKRKAFMGTDFVDPDYQSYNAQEEELAEMELQEAKNIQKRLAKELEETDFSLDILTKGNDAETTATAAEIPTNIDDLPKRQKLTLFKKDSPEFEGLIESMTKNLQECSLVILPFLQSINDLGGNELCIVNFVKTLKNLLLTYSNNVVFYLLLKAKRIPIKYHPVVKRLFQLRQLIDKLQERYTSIVKPQIQEFLVDFEADNIERIIEDQKETLPMLKIMRKVPKTTMEEEPSVTIEEDMESNEEEEEDTNTQEDEEHVKRKISYQMAKNKGLTPKRKSEQRNPRVRNRNKFATAIKKRNKVIRPVQKEISRYAGEATGINAFVSRSTKLK